MLEVVSADRGEEHWQSHMRELAVLLAMAYYFIAGIQGCYSAPWKVLGTMK